ncbi:Na(+) H(+) antiporter subunit C, partial [hydrothermal vent metagenome]
MDDWIDFALGRYNYWIAIVLMMTGLYIVYERGNLVKKVVGLNLFQTSVFIFYITIGKIAGGTAPIYIGGELEHGEGKGEGEAASE